MNPRVSLRKESPPSG